MRRSAYMMYIIIAIVYMCAHSCNLAISGTRGGAPAGTPEATWPVAQENRCFDYARSMR